MAELKVTASQLRTKAQTIRSLNSSLDTQIGVLEQAESSVCSMWDGEAKNAFHQAFTHDKAQMKNFKNAIDKYVTALEQIAQSYEKAENQNVQTATTRTYR